MKRSRLDIRLGRNLRIGQEWRGPTGARWRVRQVHRYDCHVDFEAVHLTTSRGRPLRETVSFEDIRKSWELLVPATELAA